MSTFVLKISQLGNDSQNVVILSKTILDGRQVHHIKGFKRLFAERD